MTQQPKSTGIKDAEQMFFFFFKEEKQMVISLTIGEIQVKASGTITSHHQDVYYQEDEINASEAMEKREFLYIAGRNVNCYSHYGKQYGEIPQKIKNRTII